MFLLQIRVHEISIFSLSVQFIAKRCVASWNFGSKIRIFCLKRLITYLCILTQFELAKCSTLALRWLVTFEIALKVAVASWESSPPRHILSPPQLRYCKKKSQNFNFSTRKTQNGWKKWGDKLNHVAIIAVKPMPAPSMRLVKV